MLCWSERCVAHCLLRALVGCAGLGATARIVHGEVPIGDDNFIRLHLDDVWKKVEADARRIHNTLRDHPQHRHQMLTLSTQHTIDYWLQHVHADHTLELAQRMDALITELSNDIASIDIDAVPLGPERK
ncbi:hypothetical protein T492DRAFT_853179 [Pavlovales sp. CCMP2436]|nr:hypothetical protein T492DRAFT_853179 [Pavlovales sp. CCMP2436]